MDNINNIDNYIRSIYNNICNIRARLFLRNRNSGKDIQRMAELSTRAGAGGVGDLAKAGASGRQQGNLSRDLLKKLSKDSFLPELYWASIPCRNPATGVKKEATQLPFLLPHEVLWSLKQRQGDGKFCGFCEPPTGSALPALQERFCHAQPHVDPARLVALGLHGDGVPHQRGQGKSVEAFSWNFAAQPTSDRIGIILILIIIISIIIILFI